LAEIVPKISEVNNICMELKRDSYSYEPYIKTEVMSDGRKVSRVACKVYPDRTNRDVFNILEFDRFEDVYFAIKDKYESLTGDDDDQTAILKDLHHRESDPEIFGLSSESDWQLIGYMYYFLISIVNLVETKNDESPIIDEKGSIQGRMSYSLGIELYDYEGSKPLNILKYSSLNDLTGKYLKLIIELRQAKDIPEKLAYETQCRYQWLDVENTEFQTKIVESGGQSGVALSRNPAFGYRAEHTIMIDDELISKMLENTLRFGVYGKVEQKRRQLNLFSPKNGEEVGFDFSEAA